MGLRALRGWRGVIRGDPVIIATSCPSTKRDEDEDEDEEVGERGPEERAISCCCWRRAFLSVSNLPCDVMLRRSFSFKPLAASSPEMRLVGDNSSSSKSRSLESEGTANLSKEDCDNDSNDDLRAEISVFSSSNLDSIISILSSVGMRIIFNGEWYAIGIRLYGDDGENAEGDVERGNSPLAPRIVDDEEEGEEASKNWDCRGAKKGRSRGDEASRGLDLDRPLVTGLDESATISAFSVWSRWAEVDEEDDEADGFFSGVEGDEEGEEARGGTGEGGAELTGDEAAEVTAEEEAEEEKEKSLRPRRRSMLLRIELTQS